MWICDVPGGVESDVVDPLPISNALAQVKVSMMIFVPNSKSGIAITTVSFHGQLS